MTPEYLLELADIADPDQLWRLPGAVILALPKEKRAQLDMGVALRRHADDVRRVRELADTGRSLLLTPLEGNARRIDVIETPRHIYLAPAPLKIGDR